VWILGFTGLVAAALIGTTAAATTSVVVNGSFEAPAVSSATFVDPTSWSVTNPVKIVPTSAWAAEQGSQSVELVGSTPGGKGPSSMEQRVSTVKNDVYTITFSYGANPNASGNCANPAIEVLWDGSRIGSTTGYTATPASKKAGSVSWMSATIQLAAPSTSGLLGFRSLDSGSCTTGMALDDVTMVDSQGTPSLDGVGMMTVSPTTASPGSTGAYTFHYGANPNASPNPDGPRHRRRTRTAQDS
jgi:hypothetical protein